MRNEKVDKMRNEECERRNEKGERRKMMIMMRKTGGEMKKRSLR